MRTGCSFEHTFSCWTLVATSTLRSRTALEALLQLRPRQLWRGSSKSRLRYMRFFFVAVFSQDLKPKSRAVRSVWERGSKEWRAEGMAVVGSEIPSFGLCILQATFLLLLLPIRHVSRWCWEEWRMKPSLGLLRTFPDPRGDCSIRSLGENGLLLRGSSHHRLCFLPAVLEWLLQDPSPGVYSSFVSSQEVEVNYSLDDHKTLKSKVGEFTKLGYWWGGFFWGGLMAGAWSWIWSTIWTTTWHAAATNWRCSCSPGCKQPLQWCFIWSKLWHSWYISWQQQGICSKQCMCFCHSSSQ